MLNQIATVLLLAILQMVAAAPAPVAVTVYQTQYVAATATAVAGTSPAAAVAPVATTPAVAPVAATTPVVAAPAVAATTAAAAAAPAASTASKPFSFNLSSLTSFLDSSFVSSFLSFFDIGSAKTSTTASSLPVTSTSLPVASTLAPLVLPSAAKSSVTSANTYIPTTLSTATLSNPAVSNSAGSSVPSGSLYSQMALDSRVDVPWAVQMVDGHNTDRAQHQAPPLSWSNAAYQYAQQVADNYDCSGVLTHTGGPFGENLAAGYQGLDALQAWYVEGVNFPYGTENEYNHFTQVVWKSSTSVGCAWKDCSAENWGRYIVCEYDPPGNVIGYEAANVLPPVSSS